MLDFLQQKNSQDEFTQLSSDHFFGDKDLLVGFAIVDSELEANEVR
jgi:hypothetical protein